MGNVECTTGASSQPWGRYPCCASLLGLLFAGLLHFGARMPTMVVDGTGREARVVPPCWKHVLMHDSSLASGRQVEFLRAAQATGGCSLPIHDGGDGAWAQVPGRVHCLSMCRMPWSLTLASHWGSTLCVQGGFLQATLLD